MSVSSNGSQLSINYNGEEMDLEQMLDQTVKGIQTHLNDLQLQLRQVAQSDDRNDDFCEIVEFKKGNILMPSSLRSAFI